MKLDRIKGQSGITIIEVLVASLIFVLGFSLLVALLDHTLVRMSIQELETAKQIGNETLLSVERTVDTNQIDTTFEKDDVKYRVLRSCEVDGQLCKYRVLVKRAKTDKTLIDLYDEFILSN